MLYLYFLLYIVYIIIYIENKTVHLASSGCTPSQERKEAASSGCTWRLVGAVRTFQTDPGRGQGATYHCGGAVVLANQSSQDRPHKCIALNINYLFSPLGYAVQRQYIGEMVIVLKV